MSRSKYCPFQQGTVPCTPKCALNDEVTNLCDISRIAISLDDLAGELEEINIKPAAQEGTANE